MSKPTDPVPNIAAAVEAGRARGRRMRAAIPQLARRGAAARVRADAVLARVRAARLTLAPPRLEETVSSSAQCAQWPSRSDRSVVEINPPQPQ